MFPDIDPAEVALAISDAGDQIEAAVRMDIFASRRFQRSSHYWCVGI